MSAKYKEIERFYLLGVWGTRKVKDAVKKGWLTAEEYEQLTGKAFS